ncbi:MAG TPA: ABC transporter ATP-binding protein [Isosphaeraceae bacterium]|jgi:ABC-type multidrug transport system fused ATPase/permease subunit|nr:ABC transporter ATP-binding protein [Isosphaeraceae bacterium]
MHAAAYRRARKLLDTHPGAVMAAKLWGAVHALLLLAILGWAGLLLSLILSRGETQVRAREFPAQLPSQGVAAGNIPSMPDWLVSRLPLASRDDITVPDTGVYPIVNRNLDSRNVAHGLVARGVLSAMRSLPTLRYNVGALMTLLVIGLTLMLAFSVVEQLRLTAMAEASSQVATALRRQLHRQMYRLGQSSLPTEGIGPIINLFTREVNDVRDGILADLDHKPRTPILIFGLILAAFLASWTLAIFLVSLGLLVWVTARALNRGARQAAEAASRDAAVQLCLLHEDLGLLRTVRVYGMEQVDSRRFDEHLERFAASDVRRIRTEGTMSPTSTLLVGAAMIMSAGLVGFNILEDKISPGAAAILIGALVGLWRPLENWRNMHKSLRQANRSAGAVFEFLERKPELHQAGGAKFLPPLREKITFEDISLQSHSGRILLDGVTFEIPARTRTGILGLDEDSKHALACLIPRLIDPKYGRVSIDGLDLRDVTLESIRAQVATVLQADLVFSDSVAANIGLGDPSYTLPRIIEAAKTAHAHHFIQDLPHGYDTIIGPLGHYLRTDEQYRIALARAFLHDPSIVIIEEPNLTLDDATKHLLDDTIARLAAGRTLLFLPHRLSTIRSCDQVIVLHEGRIESIGAARQLQDTSKLLRHLQYIEFNQFATGGEIEAGQMNA